MTPTLPAYLRAAKRKHADARAIFETARADGFDPGQLARLVDVLRDRHSRFKLTRTERDPLIDGLLSAGWTPTKIAERLGCSRTTVHKRAETHAATSRPTPTDRINKRSDCPVSSIPGLDYVLSFSAAGTASGEYDEIRELLGVA